MHTRMIAVQPPANPAEDDEITAVNGRLYRARRGVQQAPEAHVEKLLAAGWRLVADLEEGRRG